MSWLKSTPPNIEPTTFPSASSDDIKVSSLFPSRLIGCEKPTDNLFKCINEQVQAYTKIEHSPQANTSTTSGTVEEKPNLNLTACASSIKAYDICSLKVIGNKKNAKFNKVQQRVPADYRYVGR